MRTMASGLVAVGMLAAAMAAPGLGAQADTFEWSASMSAGQVLAVRGIVGEIRAEYVAGGRAEVVATKDGRPADFGEVEIRVVDEGDGYTVCAIYNASTAVGDGCDDVREDGGRRGRRRSIDVGVDYLVRVPAGVEFVGSMVSGDIVARDLRSEVSVNTVNGDISVTTSERARANTVSGSIEIDMGATDWDELEFKTVSGDITLWLPDGVATDVEFESISGDMRSDFEITTTGRRSGRWVGSRLEGWVGSSGERRLDFETVSGDVELRRSR